MCKGYLLALYHFRMKVHSRSPKAGAGADGGGRRSVVACAAYRSGQTLWDDFQGRSFSYDKPDVVHTEIVAPEGAPSFVYDRQTLWNTVERAERRKDAALAREAEITLPRELTPEQRIAVVRSFVQEAFVARGMVADIAIHVPRAADGRDQPHAHVLCVTRRLDASTPTGFAAKKELSWDEPADVLQRVNEARKRFNNTRSPEDKEALDAAEALRNIHVWRKGWQDHANRALAQAGSPARIDHRTLEAQGILRQPQTDFGLARHVRHLYDGLRQKLTVWVAIKRRASLLKEVEHLQQRDPAKLADLVMRLSDMAESFAAQFKRDTPTPEADYER